MKVLLGTVGVIAILMFPFVGHAQVRVDTEQAEAPLLVFEDIGDTWQGPAGMMILENGLVLISPRGVEGDESVWYDEIVLKVDTEALSIVWAGGEIFFDRDGAQVRERGLRPQQVYKESFPNDSAESDSRYSLLELEGDLYLEQDEATGAFQMTLVSEKGEIFELSGSADPTGDTPNQPQTERNTEDNDSNGNGYNSCGKTESGNGSWVICNKSSNHPYPLCLCDANGAPNTYTCIRKPIAIKVDDPFDH